MVLETAVLHPNQLHLPYLKSSPRITYAIPTCTVSGWREKRKSYGLICISRSGYAVLTVSPSYFAQRLRQRKCSLHKWGKLCLNSNEYQNLLLASFPAGSVEGQYTPPRGKTDAIDGSNCCLTKIREFLEETKFSHPRLLKLAEQHYRDPAFTSFLNDKEFTVSEEWIGLDNNLYAAEYSIFIIDSLDELEYIGQGNKISPDFVIKSILPFSKSSYRKKEYYCRRFKYNAVIDKSKKTVCIPVEEAFTLLNAHRLQIFKQIDTNKILELIKKYRNY